MFSRDPQGSAFTQHSATKRERIMRMCGHSKSPGFALLALLSVPAILHADSPWLYGIHWVGSISNASDISQMTGGKPIWTLETVMTHDGFGFWGPEGQLSKFTSIVNDMGHTIIMRVQPVWGKAFPLPWDTDPSMADFLDEVTHTAQIYQHVCHIWHLGNEMNLLFEWDGHALLPEPYIDAAVQFSDRIKAVSSSLGPQIVLVGPVGIGDAVGGDKHMACTEYINRMCDHINNNNYHDKFDGFAIHAYGNWYYTNINQILPLFETDIGAGYRYQIGLIDAKGFTDSPIYMTKWNRYTGSPNGPEEYASAEFLHTALARMHTWNQSHHPVVCACWFIYPNDPAWSNYSLLSMKNSDDHNHDCWHAFQYAAGFNYPAGNFNVPVIELSSTGWSRSIIIGTNLPNDIFTVRNAGAATLHYTIADNVGWLYVMPSTGSSTGEPDTINVVYTTTSLDVGDYSATITVSDPNAGNSPQAIAVTLKVKPIPGDLDHDRDVDQEDFGHFQACLSGAGIPQNDPDCLDARLDHDDDVDSDDFGIFQGCMSGADVPANPNCAG